MNRLEIPVRKNYFKDDSLTKSTYPSKYITCSYGQSAIAPFSKSKGLDTNNRWYIKPNLLLSSILDSIFFKKIDTTYTVFIKAAASIAHELTHYFQNTYISDKDLLLLANKGNRAYFNLQNEKEAYAVDAYYFLYFTNRDLLKKLLKMKYTNEILFNELSIASDSLQYPQTYMYLHQR